MNESKRCIDCGSAVPDGEHCDPWLRRLYLCLVCEEVMLRFEDANLGNLKPVLNLAIGQV